MHEDRLAPRSPFGTALIQMPTASTQDGSERSVSKNPAEVLASLMDFPGSVALAELLDEPLPKQTHDPRTALLGEELLDSVRARLDALEPLALKPLSGRRAPPLLPPHDYMALLARHGLGPKAEQPPAVFEDEGQAPESTDRSSSETQPRTHSATALSALTADLGDPFFSALGTSLRQAQAHIGTLRWEIAHEIRALSPTADRLERIDAALTRAMQGKMGELLDRMEYAAQLTFERACGHALMELPPNFGEEDLLDWSSESGWLGRYRERCIRMTKALFGHLRRGLEGLLRSATYPGVTADSTDSMQGEDA